MLILLLVIGILYFVYRSIFVVHYLLLERITIRKAFLASFDLTRKIGIKKILLLILQNIFWIFLFTLPVIAIGLAFARWAGAISKYLGDWTIILASVLNWFMEFLFISLP